MPLELVDAKGPCETNEQESIGVCGPGVQGWRGKGEAGAALLSSSAPSLFSPDLPMLGANAVISFRGSFLPGCVALVSSAMEEEERNTGSSFNTHLETPNEHPPGGAGSGGKTQADAGGSCCNGL